MNWKTITRGGQDPQSGLHTLSLQHNSLRTENSSPEELFPANVYECKSKQQLIDYHHASCWSPTQSIWVKAIKHFFHFMARPNHRISQQTFNQKGSYSTRAPQKN